MTPGSEPYTETGGCFGTEEWCLVKCLLKCARLGAECTGFEFEPVEMDCKIHGGFIDHSTGDERINCYRKQPFN
jgi:hypothetical protein